MRIDRNKDGMVKAGVAKLFGSRKYIKPIAIAMALVLIIGVIANATNSGSSAASTEIKETQAKLGDVSKTISASGTLSDDASINIKIPEGVILSDILVSEGDAVKKGDVLAKVNRASAAKVILQLEEEADDIEDALNSLSGTSDTTSDAYLKKVVYDEELSNINSAISKLRDMLDTGTVTASKSGTITSVNATEGESVSAASESSVNSSSSQGASGTSSTKTVSANTTNESTNTTNASANTTNASANLTNAAASASKQSSANLTGSAALLAAMDAAGIEAAEAGTTDIVTAATDTAEEESDDAGYTLAASSTEDSDNASDESNEIITGDDLVTLLIAQPSAGATPQSRVASTSKYDASITWNTGAAFKAGGKYTAVVELTSKDGYRFGDASAYGISVEGGTLTEGTPKVTGGTASGNRLVLKVSFEVPEETSTGNNGDNGANGESASSDQEKSSAGGSSAGAGSAATGSNSSKKTSGSGNASSGKASSGGTSSVSTSSSSTSTSDNLIESSLEMATVFSMSSDSEVTVTVSVDEADINSVKTGQTANVTLDAVEGESFEGEITKVSNTSSTGSGGNVKYSVTITMDKTDDMKSGMTASAVINIKEANDVIVIPSAAINEKNGEAYVYTRNENDELSGKTVVTTGLSDGNMVEITSGLSEGDTVYYEVRTKGSSSDNSSREKGGEMSGMPEMGGGSGEMPQGGPGGNGGGPSGN